MIRPFPSSVLLAGAALSLLAIAEAAAQAPVENSSDVTDAELEAELGADETEVEAVVVTAERLRGAVPGDILPEIQLDAADIRALGAGSVTELLEALAPQIRSGRGRGDGPPVVLVNGRRVSGFSEIRNLPPEAIERVDILPEEAALRFGYRADQRVVNFVLRQRFRAVTAEVEARNATAGGREGLEADLNFLRINRNGRWSFDVEAEHQGALLESERDLQSRTAGGLFDLAGNVGSPLRGAEIDPALSALVGRPVTLVGAPAGAPTLSAFAAGGGAPNATDVRGFRTLLPETDNLSLSATANRGLTDTVSATLNGRFETADSLSLIGLPSATITVPEANPFSPFARDVNVYRLVQTPRALTRESRTDNAALGLVLNGDREDWRWSFNANLTQDLRRVRTDTGVDASGVQARVNAGDPGLNPFSPLPESLLLAGARDLARSTTRTAGAEFVASGPLRELPAGPLNATLRAGAEARTFDSLTVRRDRETETELSRERGNLQASLDLPIASRRREVLTGLGNLSFNLNAEVDQLSDFGTLRSLGYGLNWSPFEKLRLIVSVTEEEGAPSVGQLGDPVLQTPNALVFDAVRGETVEVLRLDGGNPALRSDSRQVIKLGLNLKPWAERDLTVSVDYNRSRIDDPISAFPSVTAEIERAFPERFVRDETGRLVSVDNRPVNFARSEREEVRWGFNYSRPIRRAPGTASGAEAAPVGGPRREGGGPPGVGAGGEGGGFRGPGGGGRGGFGGGPAAREGRLQLALYHTWRLEDSILIRPGVPELDLLDGSAVGARGGQPEHELELQAGLFRQGLGARLEARWQSGTFVRGDAGSGGLGSPANAGDLSFSDFSTVNLRLFADLGARREWVRARPWLRGARVSLAVNNLFDTRLDVRDEAGLIPVSYQGDYLDPLGRSVRLSVRKLFIGGLRGARPERAGGGPARRDARP